MPVESMYDRGYAGPVSGETAYEPAFGAMRMYDPWLEFAYDPVDPEQCNYIVDRVDASF